MIDPSVFKFISTQEIEKRLARMDANLYHTDDLRMQKKMMETMAALSEELEKRKQGIR
jgi:hypothetical protein